MDTVRNSYVFSRIIVWLNAGPSPSVTFASSTIKVNELGYRTLRGEYELVSRHISCFNKFETVYVDQPMLDQLRRALTCLSNSIRSTVDGCRLREGTNSNGLFQPRQDGWFAMFDGRDKDVRAFHYWLNNLLA